MKRAEELINAVKWDRRFLDLASTIASWSKDPDKQVGSVIVGPSREVRSTGYNGPPPGIRDDEAVLLVKPEKLLWWEHAERNAIYLAASTGTPVRGCTLYCTSMPCADCARGIIRAGLVRVIVPDGSWRDLDCKSSWKRHWEVAEAMFREAGVELEVVP